MRSSITIIALFGCLACSAKSKDDTAGSIEDTFPDTVPGSLWGDSVTELTTVASVTGDLADGRDVDLSFGSQSDMACWPATEATNFEGNHLYYAVAMPADTELSATVTPDADVDVSLYMYQLASDSYYTPDDVPYSVTCEAAYDQANDSNPGEPESATVTSSTNPYNVFIGVAGAAGELSGGFRLTLSVD